MSRIIVIELERCLACKSCEIACAVAHSRGGSLEAAMAEKPRLQSRVKVEPVGEFAVPLQCRHCEDAPCIVVCPTAAIHRIEDKGPVLIEQERCIGCKFCIIVCPFGVIESSSDGKVVVKCDLCIERTKAGLEPACVQACPTKALRFVQEKDIVVGKRREAAIGFVMSSQKDSEDHFNSTDSKDKARENSQ